MFTATDLGVIFLVLLVAAGMGLSLYFALFVTMERGRVPLYLWHLQRFGIALLYAAMLLIAALWLGLGVEVARRLWRA